MALKADTILERIFRAKTVELAWRITGSVVPNPDIVTVGIEDHWPLAMHPLKPIGVIFGLLLTQSSILAGLFGFDDSQRFAVVVPKHVVGVTQAGLRPLMQNFNFLTDLSCTGAVVSYDPASHT